MRASAIFTLICLLLLVAPTQAQDTPNTLPRLEPITAANAGRVQQVGILGYGLINHIAGSPDGKTLAVSGSTGVTLYDAQGFDTKPYRQLPIPEEMTRQVAFSPDGTLLATTSGAIIQPKFLNKMVLRLWMPLVRYQTSRLAVMKACLYSLAEII